MFKEMIMGILFLFVDDFNGNSVLQTFKNI